MILRWLFGRKAERPIIDATSFADDLQAGKMPTVRFDPRLVTPDVKEDIRRLVYAIPGLRKSSFPALCAEAIISVERGRDLAYLCQALGRHGVPKDDISLVALFIQNRSTSIININRAISMGIKQGIWQYAKAPCWAHYPPNADDEIIDASHAAADGKKFPLTKGLMIGKAREFPGMRPGCKCIMRSVIPGFD